MRPGDVSNGVLGRVGLLAALVALVALLCGAEPAAADVLTFECKGQVNFTARFDLEAKTMTYVGKGGRSYELDRADETTFEWTEADDYGISTNTLQRQTGYYTEVFVHYKDRRRDQTKAVCKPVG